MAFQSIVEQKICSRDFPYLQPYFYNHPYALRCELGIGDTTEAYMENARKRALEIYHILFSDGADAIMYNYWMSDDCDSGDAHCNQYESYEDFQEILQNRIERKTEQLVFLAKYQYKYRHKTVRDLQTYDEPGDELYGIQRRNRMIFYSDGIGFDFADLIEREFDPNLGHEVSFVSFKNECIFSVYDDRGCDVVFMTAEKMRQFYYLLQPYFLEYDIEEMKRRFQG